MSRSYPCAGVTLHSTVEWFCDENGEVYAQIKDGIKTYHNRINGWHSPHPVRVAVRPPTVTLSNGLRVLTVGAVKVLDIASNP